MVKGILPPKTNNNQIHSLDSGFFVYNDYSYIIKNVINNNIFIIIYKKNIKSNNI